MSAGAAEAAEAAEAAGASRRPRPDPGASRRPRPDLAASRRPRPAAGRRRRPDPDGTVGGALSADSEEYLTWLAVEQGRARNTLLAYRRDLVAFESYLHAAGIAPDAVDPATVEAYLAHRRAQGLGPAAPARAPAPLRGRARLRPRRGGGADGTATDREPWQDGRARVGERGEEQQ